MQLGALVFVLGTAGFVAVPPQTVPQGEPQARPIPTAYRSPMIIETVFIAGDKGIWNKKGFHESAEYTALVDYTCDNVALHGYQRKGT